MTFADSDLIRLMPRLRVQARRLTQDAAEADDLMQDTMVRAISNRDRFIAGTNLAAWLTIIMRNHFLSQCRRKRFVGPMPDMAEVRLAATSNLDAVIELDQMREALTHLKPEQREAVLAAADGETIEEIAERLGAEVGTIKSRISRGRQALQLYFQA